MTRVLILKKNTVERKNMKIGHTHTHRQIKKRNNDEIHICSHINHI